MKTGQERLDAANEFTIRMEGVIDIASSIEHDQFERPYGMHEDLVDDIAQGWIESRYDASMKPLFEAFNGVDFDHFHDDEYAYHFHSCGLLGYVAKFATPIYNHIDECGSCSFSWGYRTTNWFYGDTIEECWLHAVEWSKRHKAKSIAKSKK